MNPDELRKVAKGVHELRQQEEQQEEETRYKESFRLRAEQEWAKARQAVADLENVARRAAEAGQFEAAVYKTEQFYSPSMGFMLEYREINRGLFRKRNPDWVIDIRYIPDYAQYVFDSCPSNLSPHWEAFRGGGWTWNSGSAKAGWMVLLVNW